MKHPTPPHMELTGEAHVTELSAAMDRLREEHEMLARLLEEMEEQAVRVGQAENRTQAWGRLQHLRLWTIGVMQELDAHSGWEEETLFPFLASYFRLRQEPTMIPSLWMMEKEHAMAEEYVETFMREFHKLRADSPKEEMKKAAGLLIQACYILKSHLAKEEQIVFPLAEQVLTDVDYLFA
ncbi:hemerythrin domain-containing protein [Paenibacillus sp. S-38]|uniref:hemerythrin domain-containing protein n=1 Tax=Paenibacillus sp. S-38 TaxID=3416710 RepID=UPI003CEFD28B